MFKSYRIIVNTIPHTFTHTHMYTQISRPIYELCMKKNTHKTNAFMIFTSISNTESSCSQPYMSVRFSFQHPLKCVQNSHRSNVYEQNQCMARIYLLWKTLIILMLIHLTLSWLKEGTLMCYPLVCRVSGFTRHLFMYDMVTSSNASFKIDRQYWCFCTSVNRFFQILFWPNGDRTTAPYIHDLWIYVVSLDVCLSLCYQNETEASFLDGEWSVRSSL